MLEVHRILTPLRILLVLAFAFLLVMELLSIPGDILDDLQRAPRAAHLLVPMLVVAELLMIGAQIIILCTWKLLTMAKKDRIFSEGSLKWVDGIVWTLVTGWMLFAALAVYLTAVIYFTPEIRDPGTPVLLFGITLLGAVFVLIVTVLRALLRQATALRSDMEAVI